MAISMVGAQHFQKLLQYDRPGFLIALGVAALTLIVDPMIGILAGTAVALLFFVNRLSHGPFDLKVNSLEKGMVDWVSGESLPICMETRAMSCCTLSGQALLYQCSCPFVAL
ncbi:MAG: hypothetical protein WDN67_00300 [Candidatus Moraniibacteriota bacterium]